MLKQNLQIKLSQKLSPQQIQLMKLIQLSTLEFEQRLSREIEENPALEENKSLPDNENGDEYSEADEIKITIQHKVYHMSCLLLSSQLSSSKTDALTAVGML